MIPVAVSVESLEVRYAGKTILQVPHLSVGKGEILTLIGPNGAGKSTLLQVLGLLQKPSEGQVFLGGNQVTGSSDLVALRRRLALVFQEPLLFRGTVFDNVTLGLRLRRVPKREIQQRAELWLEKLNICHLASRSVATLSVGEAQRVNLARSLVLDPELFLLDEPFASLDPPTHASMVEEFHNILRQTNTTTIFVTHSRTEAQMFGDRLAVMIQGKIVQMDSPQEVFLHPANGDVAGFLGLGTIVKGRVLSTSNGLSRIAMDQHQIAVSGTYRPGEDLLLCLRSEDITILLPGCCSDLDPTASVVRGTVTTVIPLENQFKVIVDCGQALTVLVSRENFMKLSLARGKQVLLSLTPRAVHIMANGQAKDR